MEKIFKLGDKIVLSGGRTGTVVQLSSKKVKVQIVGESARWIDKVKI